MNYNVRFHIVIKDFTQGEGRQFPFESQANFLIEDVSMDSLPKILTDLTAKKYMIDSVIPTMSDRGY